jgi:hypothetical protein
MNHIYKLWLPVVAGAIMFSQISTASAEDNKWQTGGRGGKGGKGGGAAVSHAAGPAHVAAPRVNTTQFSAPRMNTQRSTAPRVSAPVQHVATPRSFATTSRNLNRNTVTRTNPVATNVNRNATITRNAGINRNAITNQSTFNRGNRNLASRNNLAPGATGVTGAQTGRFNTANRNLNRFGTRNNTLATNSAVRANRNFAAVNSPRNVNSTQFAFRAGAFHPAWNTASTYYWNNHHWRCYNGVWAVVDVGWPGDWYGYPYPFVYDNTVYYEGDVYDPDVVVSRPAMVGGSMVADVQTDLANQGYNPGPIDGVIGPQTSDAIAQYQQDHGLQPTGQINGPLLDSLGL